MLRSAHEVYRHERVRRVGFFTHGTLPYLPYYTYIRAREVEVLPGLLSGWRQYPAELNTTF